MRLWLILALCFPGFAATVRVSCGGPGGVDAQGNVWQGDGPYATGGATWAMPAQQFPYNNLRFSNPPGSPFSYSIFVNPPLTAGQYIVTLKFSEPTVTAAGKRRFSVAINGVQVIKDLDLFAAAGLLKPYDLTFPVTANGVILIVLTPTSPTDKAVISGIQLDSPPPIAPIPPQTGALMACWTGNVSSNDLKTPGHSQEITVLPYVGGDWRIEHLVLCEVQQFVGPATYTASMGRPGTNNYELTGTLMPLGVAGENCWYSRPVPPQFSSSYSVVVNVASSTGDVSQLTVGNLKWELCGYSALSAGAQSIPIPGLLALETCNGSGTSGVNGIGWNCAGLFHAAIGLQDGSAISIVGPNMALPVAPLTRWTPVK
jgi:hypothetical protein